METDPFIQTSTKKLPMFRRLNSFISTLFGRNARGPRYGFKSSEEFAQILRNERQRADRAGAVFSLLAFSPESESVGDATYESLKDILSRRLRNTDETGWLDEHRVAASLPGTPAAGAWRLAEDVCHQFPEHVPAPVCTILTYPTDGAQKELRRDSGRNHRPRQWSVQPMETLFMVETPMWKRTLDIFAAGTGLIVLSPLFAVVAILVKLTSPGPVFYTQLRSGQGGEPFRIFKFRSMVVDADNRKKELLAINEQDGPAFKVRNDPRVTKIGKFLRKTSIDELPQLWNVLRGDMTLVGPRAMYCPETEACAPWQRRRLDVRQGITCIWQVRGRSSVPFDQWMRMDIEYIGKRSLWADFKLLLQTIPAVLFRRGAC
jgi:lipopolysaccharide/colanic/teichoic acid biosynthesis glycosyltransferase